MYVYKKNLLGSWEVGFYTPKGEWISENDYKYKEAASSRVNFLNGGSKH